MKVLRMTKLSFVILLAGIFLSACADAATYAQQLEALNKEKEASEAAVKAIVNQPVQSYPLNTYALLQVSSPGWFHKGAQAPDYSADIRKTQEFPYTKTYVTSDVTPGLMYKSTDVEFNKMLKAYYTDVNLPKKRLSEAEMIEINRLYRIIGNDKKKIEEMQGFVYSTTAQTEEFMNSLTGTALQLILLTAIGFFTYRKWFARKY